MNTQLRRYLVIASLSLGGLAPACASTVPGQLVMAREAYQNAASGPAADLAPAELKDAEEALGKAEGAYKADGADARTDDLAYIAERRAEIATAIAERRQAEKDKASLEAKRTEVSDQLRVQAVTDLKTTQKQLDKESDKVAEERTARMEAEQEKTEAEAAAAKSKAEAEAAKAKADDMRKEMARWAQLVENERGLVITMSSGVLFQSGKSQILPAASVRLTAIAGYLRLSPERKVIVEGHTDSAGPDSANMILSQARADSVRAFLVSQGVPAERVTAVGHGESQPVADNATVEGRATNRRVEIVLAPLPVPPPPVAK
ncbi:MAG: OmpA family protein [Myxococcota bacterium]